MDEIVTVLGKVRQYRVAAVFVSLNDFESVKQGVAVLVRPQFLGQVIVVEARAPIIPELYGSFVYLYVAVDVRPSAVSFVTVF